MMKRIKLLSKNWANGFVHSFYYVGCFFIFTLPNLCYADDGDLPFNTSLDEFKASFVSAIFDMAIILMMATCLMLAFGEWSDGIKRFINVVFFISLALAAPTAVMLLFGNGIS